MINMPGTFDENGLLNIGFLGHQPDIAKFILILGVFKCLDIQEDFHL